MLVILGGLTAWGYSEAKKVRHHSEDSSVLCNLRQLSAAADQWYLENGVSTVRLDSLVGEKGYLRALQTIYGEAYSPFYTQGITLTASGIAGSRTVTYAP